MVAPNGQVTPEMDAILRIICTRAFVLATGHVHPEEVMPWCGADASSG